MQLYQQVYLSLRPFLYQFLDYISEKYEIIVYCNGSAIYCNRILDYIERNKKYFAHRLYNTHVLFENSSFSVKYYDFLFHPTRTTENTVIVETHVATYLLNLYSGIPVAPYKGDNPDDVELARLAKYLTSLAKCEDISLEIKMKVHRSFFN